MPAPPPAPMMTPQLLLGVLAGLAVLGICYRLWRAQSLGHLPSVLAGSDAQSERTARAEAPTSTSSTDDWFNPDVVYGPKPH